MNKYISHGNGHIFSTLCNLFDVVSRQSNVCEPFQVCLLFNANNNKWNILHAMIHSCLIGLFGDIMSNQPNLF